MTEPVTKEYPSCKNANALAWFWFRVVLKEGLQCVHFCTSSTSTLAFWRCTLVCDWSSASFPRHPFSPPFLPPHTPSHTPSLTPFRQLICFFQRYTLLWHYIKAQWIEAKERGLRGAFLNSISQSVGPSSKKIWKSLQDCLQTAVTRTPACGGIYALVCFLGHSCIWKIDFQQIVLGILTICDCLCHACFSVFVECDRLWMFCWSTSQWILSGWQYVKSQLLTSQCFVCL